MSGLIVHEWIAKHGGSENVLEVMARALPSDDILCLWSDASERFPGRKITETWLSKTPLRRSKAAAIPFMLPTWRSVDLSQYDSVLVSSHAFAHHVGSPRVRSKIPVHVYVHTPARYIWASDLDARGRNPFAQALAPGLRAIDRRVANNGSLFAANSDFVRRRIESSWGQPAQVIYPPVRITKLRSVPDWSAALPATDVLTLNELPGQFILGASRFVSYKRLERVIEVGEACDLPVVLAGSGPAESFLKTRASQASVPVHFVQSPSDELLYALYQKAMLFVFPPIEDFGIMPVEAMALGTPVMVNRHGGSSESVQLLKGGELMPESSTRELQDAVSRALSLDMRAATRNADIFSEETFISNIKTWTGSASQ